MAVNQVTRHEQHLFARLDRLAGSWSQVAKEPGQWCLLRWRVTGIGRFVFDTENLSVIRGASTMLDVFARHIEAVLEALGTGLTREDYTIVYAAASQADVLIRGDQSRATAAGERLCARLAAAPWHAPSAFAVCVMDDSIVKDARPAHQRLDLRIDLERMHRLELALGTTTGTKRQVDPLDRVRAVDVGIEGLVNTQADASGSLQLSSINASRFRFGQQWRFGLAEELVEILALEDPEIPYATPQGYATLDDWEKLANAYAAPDKRPWPNGQLFCQDFEALGTASRLPNYMAVIEGDGNEFSRYRNQFKTLPEIAAASVLLEMTVCRVLADALHPDLAAMARNAQPTLGMGGAQASRKGDRKSVQTAQLLYNAGDEFVLCVPGHRALDVARKFLSRWRLRAEQLQSFERFRAALLAANSQLSEQTFGIGVVVAHANAPIRHLREASGELRHSAKQYAKRRPADAREHAVDWAVLKSHDVHPEGIVKYRRRALRANLGSLTRRPQLWSDFEQLHDLARALVAADFPTRQLNDIAGRFACLADNASVGAAVCSWPARPNFSPDSVAAARRLSDGISDVDALWKVLGTEDGAAPGWIDVCEMIDVVRCEDAITAPVRSP